MVVSRASTMDLIMQKPRKENLLISKPTNSVAVPVCSVAQEEITIENMPLPFSEVLIRQCETTLRA